MTEPMTLPGRLHQRAIERPDGVALRDKQRGIWQEITWSQYRDHVAAMALAFRELGVVEGDHVAILSDNCPEWLYADLAAQSLGARGVGIYPTNPPEDVAYILEHSQSKLLVCEDQEQVDKAVEIAAQTPSVQTVLVIDPRGIRHVEDSRLRLWSETAARGNELLAANPDFFDGQVSALDPDIAAMIVYTSGTTGKPKGAMLSARNALSAADVMVPKIGTGENDVLLSYLPLCHVAEKIFSLFLPLTAGSIVHFGESIHTVQQDLREVSPTVFLGVPRIWEKMQASVVLRMKDSSWLKRSLFHWAIERGRRCNDPKRGASAMDKALFFAADKLVFRPLQERLGLRRCRYPISGAAPIGQELLAWFHAVGLPVAEGYGMTECGGVSHANFPNDIQIGSVGKVLDNLECVIAEDGEIVVRGPEVFLGYLHNPEATAETIDEEGWLHTGDIGVLDGDGRLRITGRKKEIIITAGGKNLSPEKIENALKCSPYIKEAVAIGDRRKFISALVQIDYDAVGDWAARRKIPYTDFEDLSGKAEVVQLIGEEQLAANGQLARVEQVRKIRLFPKELHQDDGELTATQKVRRRAITQIWSDMIEGIYQ
jgi:long-chain acyl-CoA synthetase